MTRALAVLVLGLAIAACAGLGGPGLDEDRAVELDYIDDELPVELIWQRELGRGVGDLLMDHQLVIEGEVLFAALPEEGVWALRADNGQRVWHRDIKHYIVGGPGTGDGLVLLGTADGHVLALARENGEVRWRSRVSGEPLAPPVAAAGVVVARTVDGRIYGFDARSGERLWVHESSVPTLTLRGVGTPVVIDDSYVVAGLDNGRLVMLELETGEVIWEAVVAVPSGRTELERLVDVDGRPLVVRNSVYVTAYQGQVMEVSLTTGETGWSREFSSNRGLARAGSRLFAVDDHSRVHAMSRFTGSPVWLNEDLYRRDLTRPVVHGDYLLVGDYRGYVHWLTRSEGRLVARHRVDPFGILAPPVTRDRDVFVLGRGGQIARLRLGQQ